MQLQAGSIQATAILRARRPAFGAARLLPEVEGDPKIRPRSSSADADLLADLDAITGDPCSS
eukprot:15458508-Alexandrium_andersonii.AAC.1